MIYVGTSGFSYDDWKGRWYAADLPNAKMFDAYAERFNAVEINSTFYRIPAPRMMESFVRRSGRKMMFCAKMSQSVTHDGDCSQEVVSSFRKAIDPAAASGVLGALLFQFPFRFHWNAENRAYLQRALELFSDYPSVVEIRHDSWQTEGARRFFRDGRINVCIVDMPRLRGLPRTETQFTGQIAYVRFHGRNAKNWFSGESAAAPYDYLYTKEELTPWIEPIKELEKKAETTFAFFNNHLNGQAPQNAEMMLSMLGQSPPKPTLQQGDLFSDLGD